MLDLTSQPHFRLSQIYTAWFTPGVAGYGEISTLPKELREKLKDEPWLSVKLKILQESKIDGTKKALLELSDGNLIETVLMSRLCTKCENYEITKQNFEPDINKECERNTVCISTQVGCPMGCVFCATGKLGFKRNLTMEEIIDQVRFWQRLVIPAPDRSRGQAPAGIQSSVIARTRQPAGTKQSQSNTIDNIVLMGQGEPLLNYDNVKAALNILLKFGKFGPRKITLSTVGVPGAMEKMLEDKDFPPVRFALSLHNAVEEERKKIIPSHQKDFLKFLVGWAKKYHARFDSRAHFIGLEYTLVPGQNDSEKHLTTLIKLASKLGRVRVNLIPLNKLTINNEQLTNKDATIKHWHDKLLKSGFTATIRHSQGQDISADCGQLCLSQKHS